MINANKDTDNMSTKDKSATQHAIAVLTEMKDSPMAEVVKALTQRVRNRKGEKFSVGEAKTAYVYLVKNGKAPGKIEKLAVVKSAKPKAAPAPKAKAPVDRKDALRAAARRAGIHKDSVAEVTGQDDDVLGIAAPEKITMDDLKELL